MRWRESTLVWSAWMALSLVWVLTASRTSKPSKTSLTNGKACKCERTNERVVQRHPHERRFSPTNSTRTSIPTNNVHRGCGYGAGACRRRASRRRGMLEVACRRKGCRMGRAGSCVWEIARVGAGGASRCGGWKATRPRFIARNCLM